DRLLLNSAPPAISFLKVNGLWQNNTNLPEAERVVALVQELLQQGQSDIGIITFNYAQQQLVQDLLDVAVQQGQLILPETVFVKNIENIQGDEKQVIVLSVGYAPDEAGKVRVQFGSLNTDKGENRLNVAVTRAIRHLYVVSSVEPEQLQVAQTLHRGPKLLREYLQFARQVAAGNYTMQPVALPEPAHGYLLRNILLDSLSETVFEPFFRKELPFSDITVKQQGQYLSVVLTDDELYFHQLSAKHTHADFPYRLQQRHWPYLRIYSREWWNRPEEVLAQLRE
ncbi:MAG: AAA domain-containing protein, partial [Hymenobacteraceae bacterium]|nr:AAA domain-containing protein [Hymenobacteraceae bacterium]MDX5396659.1 AAA domain-containing protein [Hymenobacteraceae bacterium]MDX5512724.1 AAA domain-containing protein [Hymenobacteraceae bacterium]